MPIIRAADFNLRELSFGDKATNILKSVPALLIIFHILVAVSYIYIMET